MSIRQTAEHFIYTSDGGFRVVAASPGLRLDRTPDWLRHLGYERRLASGLPVYRAMEVPGDSDMWVLARTIDAGADRWGRPGNFLVHAFCIPSSYFAQHWWDVLGVLRGLPFLDRWVPGASNARDSQLGSVELPVGCFPLSRFGATLAESQLPPETLLATAEEVCERLLSADPLRRSTALAIPESDPNRRLTVLDAICTALPCPARRRASVSTLEARIGDVPASLVCLPRIEQGGFRENLLVLDGQSSDRSVRSAYFRLLRSDIARLGPTVPSSEVVDSPVGRIQHWLCANQGDLSFSELNLLTEFMCGSNTTEWGSEQWRRLGEMVMRLGPDSQHIPTFADVLRESRRSAESYSATHLAGAFADIVLPATRLIASHADVASLVASWWSLVLGKAPSDDKARDLLISCLEQAVNEGGESAHRLLEEMRREGAGPWSVQGDAPICNELAQRALRLAPSVSGQHLRREILRFAIECLSHVPSSEYDDGVLAELLAPLLVHEDVAALAAEAISVVSKRSQDWATLTAILGCLQGDTISRLVAGFADVSLAVEEAVVVLTGAAKHVSGGQEGLQHFDRGMRAFSARLNSDEYMTLAARIARALDDEVLLAMLDTATERKGKPVLPGALRGESPKWQRVAWLEALRRGWAEQRGRQALLPLSTTRLQDLRDACASLSPLRPGWDPAPAGTTCVEVGFLCQLIRAGLVGGDGVPETAAILTQILGRKPEAYREDAVAMGVRDPRELLGRLAGNALISLVHVDDCTPDTGVELSRVFEGFPGALWPRVRSWLLREAQGIWPDGMPDPIRTQLDALCASAPLGLLRRGARWVAGTQREVSDDERL